METPEEEKSLEDIEKEIAEYERKMLEPSESSELNRQILILKSLGW